MLLQKSKKVFKQVSIDTSFDWFCNMLVYFLVLKILSLVYNRFVSMN
jgi:hypothetical protein